MKQLNLKIKMGYAKNTTITVDGSKVKFTKDKYGNYTYIHKTESNIANVKIINYLGINTKHWFISNIIFFIISLFGILDKKFDKSFIVKDCEFNVNLDKDITNFEINTLIGVNKEGESTIKTDGSYQTISNKIYIDNIAKQRLKKLKIAKIITAIILILIIILAVGLIASNN